MYLFEYTLAHTDDVTRTCRWADGRQHPASHHVAADGRSVRPEEPQPVAAQTHRRHLAPVRQNDVWRQHQQVRSRSSFEHNVSPLYLAVVFVTEKSWTTWSG